VTTNIAKKQAERPDALAVWSTLVGVYQAVLHDVVQALGEQAGIDSGVFSALAYLERSATPHRMRMSELQSSLHPRYSQPGFSRLVQRMELDGLVERRADPADRRAAILSTTRLGRRAYERANAVYGTAVQEHFGRHLTATEGANITRALQQVARRRRAVTT
jgi:DNA-binding MarR family transcriptional regulator